MSEATGRRVGRWFVSRLYRTCFRVTGWLGAAYPWVKAAHVMPWTDRLAIIREDNAFRFGKDALPLAEGAALWAEFDAEMDRLYAVMNEGKEPDLDD